jgi:hypothetical protein
MKAVSTELAPSSNASDSTQLEQELCGGDLELTNLSCGGLSDCSSHGRGVSL